MTIWLTEQIPVDHSTTERLRDRLAERAGDKVDVAYRVLPTAIGDLLVASTRTGLVRVAFASEEVDVVLQQLADKLSPRVLRAPGRLDLVARQLEEYLAGRRRRFDLTLDFALVAGYRRDVLHHLPDIAYGSTESYREVATATGRPAAVRAVGTACALNPLPLVVPCHRVLRSDGTLGGYRGGLEIKRQLLALEAGSAGQ